MSAETTAAVELNRATHPAPAAAARIVHIGLGAFHRAHQAWYTWQANRLGSEAWGIAAFTGRSAAAATELEAQDGLYTLVNRHAEGDSFDVLDVIVQAYDGADLAALCTLLESPSVGIITLTITEAGYRMDPQAAEPKLNLDDSQVAQDLQVLRAAWGGGVFARTAEQLDNLHVNTTAARLLVSLAARRAADGWPLAVVSCDNLPDNGKVARAALLGMAAEVDEQLAAWIQDNLSFVDTSIDRITPRSTVADRETVAAATGFMDRSPVVTEPFSSWVLCGNFPAGRPEWERAGAVFVEDLGPFERRKLWLLNGAHSLMSFAGALRGHHTVAQALADPVVSDWVEQFWDAAARHLTEPGLDVPGYRQALRERFANPRIAHNLSQIAMDGTLKLAARAVPVYRAEQHAGRNGVAALRAVAAWAEQLAAQYEAGIQIVDPAAQQISSILGAPEVAAGSQAQTCALVELIDPQLAADAHAITTIHELRAELAAMAPDNVSTVGRQRPDSAEGTA